MFLDKLKYGLVAGGGEEGVILMTTNFFSGIVKG